MGWCVVILLFIAMFTFLKGLFTSHTSYHTSLITTTLCISWCDVVVVWCGVRGLRGLRGLRGVRGVRGVVCMWCMWCACGVHGCACMCCGCDVVW